MNDNGESGWYTYDSVDGTYMRTKLSTPTVAQDENDTTKSELVPGIANKLSCFSCNTGSYYHYSVTVAYCISCEKQKI